MMYREEDAYAKGELKTHYYEERLKATKEKAKQLEAMRTVINPEDMPWEICREGTLKHLVNEKMDARITTIDAYIQEIPSGGRSGKHRHMSFELFYVLEGTGYDIHFDPDVRIEDSYSWEPKKDGKKYEWQETDLVFIPPMVIHQHFNTDPEKRARILVANTRLASMMGCPRWEQIEDAP